MRERASLCERHRLQRERDRALQLFALALRVLVGDLEQLAPALAAEREDRRATHRYRVVRRLEQLLDVLGRRPRGELVGDLRQRESSAICSSSAVLISRGRVRAGIVRSRGDRRFDGTASVADAPALCSAKA